MRLDKMCRMRFLDYFSASLEALWLAAGIYLISTGEAGNIVWGVLSVVCGVFFLIAIGVCQRGEDSPSKFNRTRIEESEPIRDDGSTG